MSLTSRSHLNSGCCKERGRFIRRAILKDLIAADIVGGKDRHSKPA